jgi:GDPmannose 4,6-dehydratase
MEAKSALITGISGQDGSYLAELLLSKGYSVYGITRNISTNNLWRIQHLVDNNSIKLFQGDMMEEKLLARIIQKCNPDEIYNLASMSYVKACWDDPLASANYNAVSVYLILDAIRKTNPNIRFYQASTSEIFGRPEIAPQNEDVPFRPISPYGVSKLFGYWATLCYRESYNLFACNGIMYNHESPRRGMDFVTRKITHNVAKIKLGLSKNFTLGRLDTKRDWGFSGDYVKAMWLMLQQDKPEDYVLATGVHHSVRDFVDCAFRHVGINDWDNYVNIDPGNFRPSESGILLGDSSKAKIKLGWEPKVGFEDLVAMMVDADIAMLSKDIKP